ncbi:MAG TPA: hypothetical protein VLD67_12060 [Vicinamibacterales bacterium]|nr:hypothetical protein [Vicinamibacterales bacterium]
MTLRRVLIALLAGALGGFSIFGVLVYRASSVEHLEPAEALERFAAIRRDGSPREPLLTFDEDGRVVRRRTLPADAPAPLSRLRALAYQATDRRLVSVDMPFWFFELKAPAAGYVLGGTGLDLDRLGITAADLKQHGPGIVVDHTRQNGDRLLVWTE